MRGRDRLAAARQAAPLPPRPTPLPGLPTLGQAVASMAGANFFDLSPRTIDGRYPGKAVAMLAHLVFKVRGLGELMHGRRRVRAGG